MRTCLAAEKYLAAGIVTRENNGRLVYTNFETIAFHPDGLKAAAVNERFGTWPTIADTSTATLATKNAAAYEFFIWVRREECKSEPGGRGSKETKETESKPSISHATCDLDQCDIRRYFGLRRHRDDT